MEQCGHGTLGFSFSTCRWVLLGNLRPELPLGISVPTSLSQIPLVGFVSWTSTNYNYFSFLIYIVSWCFYFTEWASGSYLSLRLSSPAILATLTTIILLLSGIGLSASFKYGCTSNVCMFSVKKYFCDLSWGCLIAVQRSLPYKVIVNRYKAWVYCLFFCFDLSLPTIAYSFRVYSYSQ